MSATDGYGNPDSPIYSHRQMAEEMAGYRRLLEYEIDRSGRFGLKSGARDRILKAADEYAMARARERYAEIKESDLRWSELMERLGIPATPNKK